MSIFCNPMFQPNHLNPNKINLLLSKLQISTCGNPVHICWNHIKVIIDYDGLFLSLTVRFAETFKYKIHHAVTHLHRQLCFLHTQLCLPHVWWCFARVFSSFPAAQTHRCASRLANCWMMILQPLKTKNFNSPFTTLHQHIFPHPLCLIFSPPLIICSFIPSGQTVKYQTDADIWPRHVDICSVCAPSVSGDVVMIYCRVNWIYHVVEERIRRGTHGAHAAIMLG